MSDDSEGLVGRFVPPPRFANAALTERARMVNTVGVTTMLLVTVLVPVLVLVEPTHLMRGLVAIGVIDGAMLCALLLNRRGHVVLAGALYVCSVLGLVTMNALSSGGIRTPGVQFFLLFVLLAGLLLGERAGVATGLLCVAIGGVLVVLELIGAISATTIYDPISLWLIDSMYIGIALLTMRLATRAVRRALRRAEDELAGHRSAQQRLRLALEAGAIGVFEIDLGTGVATADARAIAITGLAIAPDAPISIELWRLALHPDDRTRAEAALMNTSRSHVGQRVGYRVLHAELGERHVEAATYPVFDSAGLAISITGMIQDMTETRAAQVEREHLVRNLGERVKELRLLHDASILLRERDLFDASVITALVARMPSAWLHPSACRARIRFGDREYATPGWTGSQWRMDAKFRTSAGEGSVEVEYVSAQPLADEGPFLSEERDLINSIAELLRSHIEEASAEQQRRGLEHQLREAQKMEALGTLAGGIAHDFNNILTAIGGNAEMARIELPADSPAAHSLEEIGRAHARAVSLVRRILLFSRRQTAERRAAPLRPVVEEALQLLRASLPAKIAIEPAFLPSLPSASIDATQVHQVIMNLGTNAGYAMQERGGILRLAMDTVAIDDPATAPATNLQAGRYLRLTVSDTGTGMPEEVRERLFEPFFTTKGSDGTGLGLSVVHGIMRDHEGAITVASELGCGTTFTLYFPAVEAEARGAAIELRERPRGNGEHIMYVDDEPSLAYLMSRTLSRLGYRCTEFSDPLSALQEFRTRPQAFDAVISDQQMPGLSGREFLAHVVEIRPDIPVAIASGLRDENVDAYSHVRVWINKPSTLDDLSVSVRALLRQER